MEIQSAFSSGVQGFQQATQDASKAASNIAVNTLPTAKTEQLSGELNSSTNQVPDLTESIVDLKVAEYQAKSSVEVIKTADEMLGTLLDVRV